MVADQVFLWHLPVIHQCSWQLLVGEPWWMMVLGGGLPLAGCVGRFHVREMSGGGVGINVGWRVLIVAY